MDLNTPTIDKLDPKLWGQNTWEFLEMIVATYPLQNPNLEHRDAVINIFESLQQLLPCPDCRNHYIDFIKRHPIGNAVSSRTNLLNFYFNLRRDVATKNRQSFRFQTTRDMWNHITSRFNLWKSAAPKPLNVYPQSRIRGGIRSCNCSRH